MRNRRLIETRKCGRSSDGRGRKRIASGKATGEVRHDNAEHVALVSEVWVPFVVLGELRAGFLKGSRSKVNEAELANFLASAHVAVATASDATSRVYASVFDSLRRRRKPIPANDLWVAACAIEQRAALFSFDSHFAGVEGLLLVARPQDWS